MESIWSEQVIIPPCPPLAGDMETEVAVIGAGLAGCLTAFFLQREGKQVTVLEAGRIGGGQTKNTTAKITCQHGLIYDRLLQQLSPAQAQMYADANRQAVRQYRELIEQEQIDCDFKEASAYLYTTATPSLLQREWAAAGRLGVPARLTTATELPFPVAEALRFDRQAQFHPLKFLRAIAKELTIYENTPVLRMEGNTIVTDRGLVRAGKVVFACHFPFLNLPGLYFARMHQERSYVIALEGAQTMEGMYYGIDPDGLSFRMAGDALLLGGGSHRTGDNPAGGRYERLRRAAKSYWPDSRERACWSAQDCIPQDGVPFIGQYAASRPDWYVATGFQKWGMTTSMAAAHIITDAIMGRENDCAAVFSPQRFCLGPSFGNLMTDMATTVKSLGKSYFTMPKTTGDKLPVGDGGVVEVKGEKLGVYKESGKSAHKVDVRCPHLGCELAWNPDEKSWDCPCHGSRFDYTGTLLSGPAQEGIRPKKK